MELRAALIGFGEMARRGHIPWYLGNSHARLVGIVELTAAGRELAAQMLPDVPAFAHLEDLLGDHPVDMADIATHPAAHERLIDRALRSGLHVICEKPPLSPDPRHGSLARLVSLSRLRRPGQVLASCHNWNFSSGIQRLLQITATGLIGRPRRVVFTALRQRSARGATHWNPGWREQADQGGGVIGDLGYHGMYLSSRVFGRAPLRALAHHVEQPATRESAEVSATVELDFGDGAAAQLHLSWHHFEKVTSLVVEGTAGTVYLSGATLRWSSSDGPREEVVDSPDQDSWHATWTAGALTQFAIAVHHADSDAAWRDMAWAVATLEATGLSRLSGKVEPLTAVNLELASPARAVD